jgi:mannose-6-phosphate isomerase-like protein (cupin superfamily)
MDTKKPFIIKLNDGEEYQRLLPGAPVTYGMKSGRVYLKPGAECGEHSTKENEEQLVFLEGEGSAIIAEETMHVGKGKIVYIPPETAHNIKNTGSKPLVYIFCVAPAGQENTE